MEEMTKEERTRKFHQDFLWGLNHLKVAHDALMETAALRYLVRCCETRLEDLSDEALSLADRDLCRENRESGLFMHEGSMFELKVNTILEVVL